MRSPLGLFAVALLAACGRGSAGAPDGGGVQPPPGDDGGLVIIGDDLADQPLQGATDTQLATFKAGDALFDRVFTPADGLGPLYIRQACSSCHDAAGKGPGLVQKMAIVGEDGVECPRDGQTSGALMVRGPWVLRRYYRGAQDVTDAGGWFDTGDISTIDALGYMRITDRTKDVIKSGGEWISSIDIENVAVGCPGVKIAAVIGVAHPKWEERPLLIIEAHAGQAVTRKDVLDYLTPHIAKWWTPDDVIFAAIPLTATGKIDKKVLRDAYRDHLMGAG